MNIDEKLEIAVKLQQHHYFFRAFWDIGTPVVGKFSDLPTAAISFNETGDALNLLINEDFWETLNEETRMFLICHEMCHIILDHGKRFVEYYNTDDMVRMNHAADVVINEMLCESFGFTRANLIPMLRDTGCWLDTVFKDKKVPKNESTEYYFNLLKEEKEKNGGGGGGEGEGFASIDVHRIMNGEQLKELDKLINDSGVLETLDKQFIDSMPKQDSSSTRSAFGEGYWHAVKAKAKRKAKWESVIKKWESRSIKEDYHPDERWERKNPKYSQIISDNLNLPTICNVLEEYKTKNKIDVFFFLDTSGSCIGLKDRFFSAAKSLDPKKFNIRLFCFDTKVVETTLASNRVYGGGGTAFGIMENKIQELMKSEKVKYPKAVFVITDGYGNNVSPQYPKRWHWFLSEQYTHYIPKDSARYNLKDYE